MIHPEARSDTHTELLSSRIEESIVGPCRVLMVKTPVQSVVSWQGSFMTYPDIAGGERLVQGLAVQMLDKGTQHRDRFAIAEELEDRGAHLQFSSSALRTSFQGQALQADVPDVVHIMAEELRRPLFDATEFEKTRMQYKAGLQRSLENTAMQAVVALSQRIYDEAHPNYRWSAEKAIAELELLTVDHVRAYHARHFGARDMLIVFVGDIDAPAVEQAVRDAFGDWPVHDVKPGFRPDAVLRAPGRSDIVMPEKQNVDVRMGHMLSLRRPDPDYIPLYLSGYILGGNFSARLMARVRDEMGLTYGIHSQLSGITTEYDGHWGVSVTLSRENVERGVAATLNEVNRFVDEGPTAEELRDKQTTITGTYKVGMATTGGLASTLYQQAIRGFDTGYLDRFPEEVRAVTLGRVRDAVQRHFKPDVFQMAFAGTPPETQEETETAR